ncbi:MAG: class I SAM-dependent methyltransferase [Mycobacteriales bacterium]
MTTSSAAESAPDTPEVAHYSLGAPPDVWWDAHFEGAAVQILDFFGDDGISLTGKRVADVGCGDGIIDLGVVQRAGPECLVGFDLVSTDVDDLARLAKEHGGIDQLPDNLFFATSHERSIPAEDHSFDVVVSWSAFEHIADPVAVLREIRRILTHHGLLFIQLWPFYHSAHGTHLVDWFPDGFAQHRFRDEEIIARVRASGDQELASRLIDIYKTLNRITLDDLHAALTEVGFRVVKIALDAEKVHLPEEVAHLPLSHVAVSGVKLLAIPPAYDRPESVEPEKAEEVLLEPPSHQLDALRPAGEPAEEGGRPAEWIRRGVRTLRRRLADLDAALERYEESPER